VETISRSPAVAFSIRKQRPLAANYRQLSATTKGHPIMLFFTICLFHFFSSCFCPRRGAGADAEFFRLRPRRPAPAASFSSRFFRASVMSKLITFAFPTTSELIDARVLLSLFCLNKSGFSRKRSAAPAQLQEEEAPNKWTVTPRYTEGGVVVHTNC
jgi:hypothetical protein